MPAATLNLGIVGACGRGASFKAACDALGQINIRAVCDTNEAERPAARERLGAREQYTDYETMLDQAGLDAVILGTPMPLHVPQAVSALARELHRMLGNVDRIGAGSFLIDGNVDLATECLQLLDRRWTVAIRGH